MAEKSIETVADIITDTPVEVKKAESLKTLRPKKKKSKITEDTADQEIIKLEEDEKLSNKQEKEKNQRRGNNRIPKGGKNSSAYNTLNYRDLSGTSLVPGQRLFASFEDRLKGEQMPLEQRAALNLRASLDHNAQTIFTGTVKGRTKTINKKTGETIYLVTVNTDCNVSGYKGRIVRIPLSEFIAPICTFKDVRNGFDPDSATDSEICAYINSRKGSKIEFCVTYMDLDEPITGLVIGSRVKALTRRRRKFWYGKAKVEGHLNPVYVIDEGSCIDVNIVSVTQKGVFVEMFGVEAYIPLRELSHSYIETAKGHFETGQIISVIVTNIKRDDAQKISMEVSHKKAVPDPSAKFMAQYMPGDHDEGKIVRMYWDRDKQKTVYFVNIDDKFEIRCDIKKGIMVTPIVGDRVELEILDADINLEENVGKIWGRITHVDSFFARD